MLSFLKFLKEKENKSIVMTFGRFQPPTKGHAKLIESVVDAAKRRNADHKIFPSVTHDNRKNPLSFDVKVSALQEIFPSVNFNSNSSIKTMFDAVQQLVDTGYEEIYFVVGGDRVEEIERVFGKYVKSPDDETLGPKDIALKKFEVINAGDRDPDASGVKGMSGTKMREFVKNNDFESFFDGLPEGTDRNTAEKLFNEIKEV